VATLDPEWTVFVPLVSSLAGAGLGAWTAQYIAARNKRNDERMKEVRAAQAATTIAYGITDHFLSMKEQIVKPVVDQFAVDRYRFEQLDAIPKPPGLPPIGVKVPLDAFRFNLSPQKELQDIVFKELSAPIRPTMLVAVLARTLNMLEKLAEDRNAMVKKFTEVQEAGKGIDPYAYYGLPFPTGGADARYANTLQHISEYTDDAIGFSNMVGDDLRAYALALRETLPPRLRLLAPRITTMSFPKPDLLPKPDKYKSYEHLQKPLRVLGAGRCTAEFDALAFAQYITHQEHWVS
jgi:hypothetical protein